MGGAWSCSAALFVTGVQLAACGSNDEGPSGCVGLSDSACTAKHDAYGNLVEPAAEECKSASKHGGSIKQEWLETYEINLPSGGFSEISAYYIVPPEPEFGCEEGQAVYYFVGFQDPTAGDGVTIHQPVLGYWKNEGGWFIMSESCCTPSNRISERIPVKPGDRIDASIVQAGNEYVIITAQGSSSTTLKSPVGSDSYSQVVAALEVYNVEECGELPDMNFTFTITSLTDSSGATVTGPWEMTKDDDACSGRISVVNDF